MPKVIQIGSNKVGEGNPTFIIAEVGINHNGDLNNAKRLIDVAVMAGCDAVKFQKRNPEKAVPPEYKNVVRETPWGLIPYLEYRYKLRSATTNTLPSIVTARKKGYSGSPPAGMKTQLISSNSFRLPATKSLQHH